MIKEENQKFIKMKQMHQDAESVCNLHKMLDLGRKEMSELRQKVKQRDEDIRELVEVKQKLAKREFLVDLLNDNLFKLNNKLNLKTNEVVALRQKTLQLRDEHKEEMESQENFYKNQIKALEEKVTGQKQKEEDQTSALDSSQREEHMANIRGRLQEFQRVMRLQEHMANSNITCTKTEGPQFTTSYYQTCGTNI